MLIITDHACIRYIERVAPVTKAEARLALSCRGIIAAMKFGARIVKLGTGHRVILRGETVVTVIPADRKSRDAMDRMSRPHRTDGGTNAISEGVGGRI